MTREDRAERAAIRKIFRRNRGASAEIARELDIGLNAVSQWLTGYTTSERIKTAMRLKAKELLAAEAERKQREEAERIVAA
jgi:predicted transcriptional regulator